MSKAKTKLLVHKIREYIKLYNELGTPTVKIRRIHIDALCDAVGKESGGKTYLDKKGNRLEHGDFILWNPDDDDWLDIIIEHKGRLTTLYELGGGELKLKDNLLGSDNPVLKTGNIMTHHVELTHYNNLGVKIEEQI